MGNQAAKEHECGCKRKRGKREPGNSMCQEWQGRWSTVPAAAKNQGRCLPGVTGDLGSCYFIWELRSKWEVRKCAQKVFASLSRTLVVMRSKEGGSWLRETWYLRGKRARDCVCVRVRVLCF